MDSRRAVFVRSENVVQAVQFLVSKVKEGEKNIGVDKYVHMSTLRIRGYCGLCGCGPSCVMRIAAYAYLVGHVLDGNAIMHRTRIRSSFRTEESPARESGGTRSAAAGDGTRSQAAAAVLRALDAKD